MKIRGVSVSTCLPQYMSGGLGLRGDGLQASRAEPELVAWEGEEDDLGGCLLLVPDLSTRAPSHVAC